MDKVVAYLLEKETITGAEMVAILEGRDPALADPYQEAEQREQLKDKSSAPRPEEPSAPIPLGGDVAPAPEEPRQAPPEDPGPEDGPAE